MYGGLTTGVFSACQSIGATAAVGAGSLIGGATAAATGAGILAINGPNGQGQGQGQGQGGGGGGGGDDNDSSSDSDTDHSDHSDSQPSEKDKPPPYQK